MTLHGKSLGVPEMAGPMSAAVIKGALNLLLAQEVRVLLLAVMLVLLLVVVVVEGVGGRWGW